MLESYPISISLYPRRPLKTTVSRANCTDKFTIARTCSTWARTTFAECITSAWGAGVGVGNIRPDGDGICSLALGWLLDGLNRLPRSMWVCPPMYCKVVWNWVVRFLYRFMSLIMKCVVSSRAEAVRSFALRMYSTSRQPLILSSKFWVSSTDWSEQTSCRHAQLRRCRAVDISMGSREPEAINFSLIKVYLCISIGATCYLLPYTTTCSAIHNNLLHTILSWIFTAPSISLLQSPRQIPTTCHPKFSQDQAKSMLVRELTTKPSLESTPLSVKVERMCRSMREQKQLCRTCWSLCGTRCNMH